MPREKIEAWVEAHRDDLPTTLSELSLFPIPFRKVIVWALEPSDHVALWREHLLSFVGPSSSLSPEKQAFVKEAAEEFPAVFADTLGGDRKRLERFKARSKALFEPEEVRRIFNTLGPQEPEGGLPIPPDAW